MTIENITDDTFTDVIQASESPIVLDVWAPWCGPCKMVTPALERIYKDNANGFSLCLANMEDFEKTAGQLQIKSTPTLIIIKDGKEIARRSGAMMESQIKQWLNDYLSESVL